MDFNKTVNGILKHPFATAFVVGAVIDGVVKIIAAAKGIEVKPAGLYINVSKPTKPEST